MPGRQFSMLRCGMAGVSAVEARTRHVFARHTHDEFGIGVIHQGAQKSASGRGPVEAGPGQVITVNPGEVHDGAPIGDAGRSWRILYFAPEVITAALDDVSEGKAEDFEFHHPVISDAGIAHHFRALFVAMTAEPRESLLWREELLLTLIAALRPKAALRAFPDSMAAARGLIDADPAASLTLADLARVSGVSKFQLLRGFARATGLTPHAYVMQRRTDLARRAIARGESLAQAAFVAGFADQSHMTRIFTRKYGVTPKLYATAMAA